MTQRDQSDSGADRRIDTMNPSPALLCKLGSIVRHCEEAFTETGHEFDVLAVRALCRDPEVQEWMIAMDAMALLPVLR